MNGLTGIWVTTEIAKDKRLKGNEKLLLGIYMYYTQKGNERCCMLTNIKLAEMLGVSEREIKRYKKHLEEFGLIKTDGGIKVWFKGGDNSDTPNNEGGDNSGQRGDNSGQRGDNSDTQEGDNSDTHKKEIKKEKKEEKNKEDFSFEDSLVDGMDYNNKNI